MTTIKAREITPGMVIEWVDRDVFTRTTVGEYNGSVNAVWSADGAMIFLPPDTDVKVVAASPALPEPKALGARVKAGDRLFLRVRDFGYAWAEVTDNTLSLNKYTWAEVNECGPVTVIDSDPSWEVETGEDAPEQWDDIEEALKHCTRVVDSEGDEWHYTGGALHVDLNGWPTPWTLGVVGANRLGPFRRA